jgi:hypothetical protein
MNDLKEKCEDVVLTAQDRCDQCGSQAYVLVEGVSGGLMFCSHHYTKIMNNPDAKRAIESFAYKTLDKRDTVLSG